MGQGTATLNVRTRNMLLHRVAKPRRGGKMAGHERLIPCPRRPLGSDRTAAAAGTAQAQGWPSSCPGSRRAGGHHLRPAHGLSLAAASDGAGLRKRNDLLAATTGLAGSRRLAAAARDLAQLVSDEAAVNWSRASVDSLSVRAKRGARRPARTRSTAVSPAPSTTWSSTATASPWPFASRRPTLTTRPSCSRWSMPSLRSLALAGSPGVPGGVPPSCTQTRRTTLRSYAAHFAPAASRHVWRGEASTPLSD
jgi:hypothetical protein